MGYLLGAIASFVLNARFTFKARASSLTAFKYLLLHAICLSAQLLVLTALMSALGFPFWLGQLLAMVVAGILLFWGSKFWVFRLDRSVSLGVR
jgi:putative flippase GtrA